MAVVEDIYKLTTQTDASSLVATQATIRQQFNATATTLRSMGTRVFAAAQSFRQFVTARVTTGGLAAALRNVGMAAGNAAMGLGRAALGVGGLVRGAAGAMVAVRGFTMSIIGMLGPLMMIGGLFMRAIGGINGLKNSAAGGGGGAAAATEELAENMGGLGAVAQTTQTKIAGMLGAFGAVGEGYIQKQGKASQTFESQSEAATVAAKTTAAAQQQASATGAEAASRLAKAWERVAAIFSEKLGAVLLPLLDKVAEMMEDPRFLEFVTLLADDLAGAIDIVATWLIDEAIPAILDFMDEVNEAGGPVEWLMSKFGELKDTVMRIVAIILATLIIWGNKIREIFNEVKDTISGVWEGVKNSAILAFAAIQIKVIGMWNNIKAIFQIGINAIIGGLNGLIEGYNKIGSTFGLPTVGAIPGVSLAKGGIVSRPTAAIVGDATTPEAVAPLGDLVGIIQDAVGGGGGINIENLIIQAPPGEANPQAFGERAAGAFTSKVGELTRLRMAGARLPV